LNGFAASAVLAEGVADVAFGAAAAVAFAADAGAVAAAVALSFSGGGFFSGSDEQAQSSTLSAQAAAMKFFDRIGMYAISPSSGK
jgi:hypothetical protein